MKNQIRVLGVDDGPFDKFDKKQKTALLVGTFFRGGDFLDGLVSTKAAIDGNDATSKIAGMINKSKHFKPQIKAVFLDGIAVAGFNIIDMQVLSKKTGMPVVVVMRTYPEFAKMKKALVKLGREKKIKLVEKAGKPIKLGKIWFQYAGCTKEFARDVIKVTTKNSYVPEPLRLAHIIATGIVKGESSGGY